jgi:hypothetical protein
MLTDDAMIDLLKESFDADTRAVAASPQLPDAVRGRLRRRRAGRLAAIGTSGLALAALVGTTALGAQHPNAKHGTTALPNRGPLAVHHQGGVTGLTTVQLSSFQFTVPANATVTKTCLPDSDADANASVQGEVFELVRNDHGGFVTTAAGNPCIGAAFRFTLHPPVAVQQITAPGQPTVFITAPENGTRTGYRLLVGRDAIAAASAVGGHPGRYAVVMTIPADNDQAVLVAGLRQYHPGAS